MPGDRSGDTAAALAGAILCHSYMGAPRGKARGGGTGLPQSELPTFCSAEAACSFPGGGGRKKKAIIIVIIIIKKVRQLLCKPKFHQASTPVSPPQSRPRRQVMSGCHDAGGCSRESCGKRSCSSPQSCWSLSWARERTWEQSSRLVPASLLTAGLPTPLSLEGCSAAGRSQIPDWIAASPHRRLPHSPPATRSKARPCVRAGLGVRAGGRGADSRLPPAPGPDTCGQGDKRSGEPGG